MRYSILPFAIVGFVLAFAHDPEVVGGPPPIKFVNLDKLNTDADEEDPCPTPDHLGLLYASKKRGSYDIYFAKRPKLTIPFERGKSFIADEVADERAPFMWKDKYYFATNDVPDKKFEKLKNFDLMMQIGFQRPTPLLGEINTPADELYPWITPNGNEFYISRKTDEGWKLFVAKGPVPGPIGNAKVVGFDVNFHRATIGDKALTMYMQGPLEDGKIGIYRSKRDKLTAAWSKPEPVKALNHAESKKGDMQPALTLDGTRLYFVSDRPGGKGGLDIWYVATASLK
jgi:hypothetical protein